jgi:hypothetical protein
MFGGMFLAGWECSSHRRWDGQRIDMLELTRHFEFCESDYSLAHEHGLRAARDGLRWHLIGAREGECDWSSAIPMLRAARNAGAAVIWDLCHYGYPDRLDIFSEAFIDEFADYTATAVRLIRNEGGARPMICPINEMSFWAWLGGKEGKINPFAVERPHELKRQLVRAYLAAVAAAKRVDRETLAVCAEPLIHVIRDTNAKEDIRGGLANSDETISGASA